MLNNVGQVASGRVANLLQLMRDGWLHKVATTHYCMRYYTWNLQMPSTLSHALQCLIRARRRTSRGWECTKSSLCSGALRFGLRVSGEGMED
ncbi:hypothetical protein M8818_003256 [Zalaria obscura]|uniref:Uncharacterized protein n=1 Tax=Zalaria obscura TaxID=2024903 RepID=A0ACC3SG11_9PEZI